MSQRSDEGHLTQADLTWFDFYLNSSRDGRYGPGGGAGRETGFGDGGGSEETRTGEVVMRIRGVEEVAGEEVGTEVAEADRIGVTGVLDPVEEEREVLIPAGMLLMDWDTIILG